MSNVATSSIIIASGSEYSMVRTSRSRPPAGPTVGQPTTTLNAQNAATTRAGAGP